MNKFLFHFILLHYFSTKLSLRISEFSLLYLQELKEFSEEKTNWTETLNHSLISGITRALQRQQLTHFGEAGLFTGKTSHAGHLASPLWKFMTFFCLETFLKLFIDNLFPSIFCVLRLLMGIYYHSNIGYAGLFFYFLTFLLSICQVFSQVI